MPKKSLEQVLVDYKEVLLLSKEQAKVIKKLNKELILMKNKLELCQEREKVVKQQLKQK